MKDLVFIGVLLVVAINVVGCTFSVPCNDEVKNESSSPDGKYVVAFYERDCGATTDFSTMVNIRDSSIKFDGNKDVILVVKGRHQISFNWKDNRRIQVECANCPPSDVFRQEKSWKDVQIVL
jgi:hypothetical protein